MRKIALLCVALQLFLPSAFAQEPASVPKQDPTLTATSDDTDELARLRVLLSASKEKNITAVQPAILSGDFPAKPIKIAIVTGLDVQAGKNFYRWFTDWTKKDAKKYGTLEIVRNVEDADVVILRYSLAEKIQHSTTKKSVSVTETSTATIVDSQGNEVDVSEEKPVTHIVEISEDNVPVFAYILQRSTKGYDILERYTGMTPLKTSEDSGKTLWDAFKKLLRDKSDSAKRKH